MSLFIIWGESQYRILKPLSQWVGSESGYKFLDELLEALVSPTGIAEVACLLGALQSFVRLHIRERECPPPHKIQILDLDMGNNGDNLIRISHVIWFFRSIALAQGPDDTWKELLGQAVRPEDGDDRVAYIYWKYRLRGPCTHQEVVQNINGLQLDPYGTWIKYHGGYSFTVEAGRVDIQVDLSSPLETSTDCPVDRLASFPSIYFATSPTDTAIKQ